jgi:ABC-type transport system involved in cytochrome c biogenesis permease subunit
VPTVDTVSERATAAVLAGVGTFQALLAAGAPWAAASWGGRHRGVLPGRLRAVSGVGAVAYFGAAGFIAGGKGRPDARSTTFTAISIWMGVGTIANAMSPSRVERLIWTPTCAATTALAWRSRR